MKKHHSSLLYRGLAILLSVVMAFSMSGMQSYAVEGEETSEQVTPHDLTLSVWKMLTEDAGSNVQDVNLNDIYDEAREHFSFVLTPNEDTSSMDGYSFPGDQTQLTAKWSLSSDDSSHKATFDTIRFTKYGEYTFDISESGEDYSNTEKGYTVHRSDSKLQVRVVFTENAKYAEFLNGNTVITNSWGASDQPEPETEATLALTAEKKIADNDGTVATDDVYTAAKGNFTFTLADANPESTTGYTMPSNPTAQYDDDKNITFNNITFTAAGTYKFTISESGETYNDPDGNYTVSSSDGILEATVTVSQDDTGALTVSYPVWTDGNVITNTYTEAEKYTEKALTASKKIIKKIKRGGITEEVEVDADIYGAASESFCFVLSEDVKTEEPEGYELPDDREVSYDPENRNSISFDSIKFTEPGTYIFKVTESGDATYEFEDGNIVTNAMGTLYAKVVVTEDPDTKELTASDPVWTDDITVSEPVWTDDGVFTNKYGPKTDQANEIKITADSVSAESGKKITVDVFTSTSSATQLNPSKYHLSFDMERGCTLASFLNSDGNYKQGEFELGDKSAPIYASLTFDENGNPDGLDYRLERNGQTASFQIDFVSPSGTTPDENESKENPGLTLTAGVTESIEGKDLISYNDDPDAENLQLFWTAECKWADPEKTVDTGRSTLTNGKWMISSSEEKGYYLDGSLTFKISVESQNVITDDSGEQMLVDGSIYTKSISYTDKLTLPDGFSLISGDLSVGTDGKSIVCGETTVLELDTTGSAKITGTPVRGTDASGHTTLMFTVKAANTDTAVESEIDHPDLYVTLYGDAVTIDSNENSKFNPDPDNSGTIVNTVDFSAKDKFDADVTTNPATAEQVTAVTKSYSAEKHIYAGYSTQSGSMDNAYVARGKVFYYRLYLKNTGATVDERKITDEVSPYLQLLDSESNIIESTGNYKMEDGNTVHVEITKDDTGKVTKQVVTYPASGTQKMSGGSEMEIWLGVQVTTDTEHYPIIPNPTAITNKFSYGEQNETSNEAKVTYDAGRSISKAVIAGHRLEEKTDVDNPSEAAYFEGDLITWRITYKNNSLAAFKEQTLTDTLPYGLELADLTGHQWEDSSNTESYVHTYADGRAVDHKATTDAKWTNADPDTIVMNLTGTLTLANGTVEQVTIPVRLGYDSSKTTENRFVYMDIPEVPAGAELTIDYGTIAKPSKYVEDQVSNIIMDQSEGEGPGIGKVNLRVRGTGFEIKKELAQESREYEDGAKQVQPGDSISYILTADNSNNYTSAFFETLNDFFDFENELKLSDYSKYVTITVSNEEIAGCSTITSCSGSNPAYTTEGHFGVVFNNVTIPAYTTVKQKVTFTFTSDQDAYNELIKKHMDSNSGSNSVGNTFAYNNGETDKSTVDVDFSYRSVDMQKGVEAILKTENNVDFTELNTKYDFDLSTGLYVMYYATAYNNSPSPITISKFVDTLPYGITYSGLARNSTNYKYKSNIDDSYSGSDTGFATAADKSITYVNVAVSASQDADRVTFNLGENGEGITLQPGEGIQFAYYCALNRARIEKWGEADLINYLGMQSDAVLNDNTSWTSSQNTAYQNNGGSVQLSDGSAYGGGEGYWIESRVPVKTGHNVIPGINKEAIQYYDASAKKWFDITEERMIPTGSSVRWKITVYAEDDSTSSLVNYELRDQIEYPYLINTDSGSTYKYDIYRANGELKVSYDVSLVRKGSAASSSYEFTTYSADMSDEKYEIPVGGHAVLTVVTNSLDSKSLNGTFNNIADIYPTQEFVQSDVEHGEVKKNDSSVYVEDQDVVYILGSYGSIAEKRIEEADDPSNHASCLDSKNTISVYRNKEGNADDVWFTNIVKNTSSYAFDSFVMIDMLPHPDDTGVVNQVNKRDSQFSMSMADADIAVTLTDENGDVRTLSADEYTIDYSAKTKFTDDDWKGTYPDTSWGAEKTSCVSFRIILKNSFPAGNTLTVRYKSVIEYDAEGGEIAYNSFGYNYSTHNMKLTAEPQKVGVQLVDDDYITKAVYDTSGRQITDSQKFTLTIYEGEAADDSKKVTGDYWNGTEWVNLADGTIEVSGTAPVSLDTRTTINGESHGYLKVGETYTVVETIPSGVGALYKSAGMKYGTTATNQDRMTFTYEGGSVPLQISNTYLGAYTEAQPQVTKSVHPEDNAEILNPDEYFTFVLADIPDREPYESGVGYTMPEDVAETVVRIKDGQTGTFGNIAFQKAGDYYFTITEIKGSTAGMTYDTASKYVRVEVTDTGDGTLSAEVFYGSDATAEKTTDTSLTVTNTQKAPKPIEATLAAQKVIADSTGSEVDDSIYQEVLAKGEFKFTLTASADNPATGYEMPVESECKDVLMTKDASDDKYRAHFGSIKFTKAGRYVFNVSEDQTTLDLGDHIIECSKKTLTATIVVTLNKNNTLTKTVTWSDPKQTISNLYLKATDASAQLQINKAIDSTGASQPTLAEMAGKFSFRLEAVSENAPLPEVTEVTNAENGSVTFDKIAYTKEGTYKYKITELNGGIARWTYSTGTVNVTVQVNRVYDSAAHTLKYVAEDPVYTQDGAKVATDITNTYLDAYTIAVPQVTKAVEVEGGGKSPVPGEVFTFVLADIPDMNDKVGYAMPTEEQALKTEVKDGETGTFGRITFYLPGDYYFKITEQEGSTAGMTYNTDPQYARVHVDKEVSEDGKWSLKAQVYYGSEASEAKTKDTTLTVTNNEAKPEPVELPLSAQKLIVDSTGSEVDDSIYQEALEDDLFRFTLTEAVPGTTGYVMPEASGHTKVLMVKGEDGTYRANFDPITFTRAGTYVFNINEEARGLDKKDHIIDYSEKTLSVTVTVILNEDNTLSIGEVTWSDDTDTITNLYLKADETSAQFKIHKQVTGANLAEMAGAFEFKLKAVDDAPLPEKTSAHNAADGKVTFDSIVYTEEGTYEYTITEVNGGREYWEYSSTPVKVTVKVGKYYDRKEKTLKLKVDSVKYTENATVTNRYLPPDNPHDPPDEPVIKKIVKKIVEPEEEPAPAPELDDGLLGEGRDKGLLGANTGDSASPVAYGIVATAALLGAAVLMSLRRRRKK